jgi:hypothetical protein
MRVFVAIVAVVLTANSVFHFVMDALDLERGGRAKNYLAAASSVVSLLFLGLIYADPIEQWLVRRADEPTPQADWEDVASWWASSVDWISRSISLLGHGFEPAADPSVWALAVFFAVMSVRGGVFAFAHMRRRVETNALGSVFLAFVTCYALFLCLLVVGFRFSSLAVAVAGVTALVLFPILARANLFADLGRLGVSLALALWNMATGVWEYLVQAVVWIARQYRNLTQSSAAWYKRAVGDPIGRASSSVVKWSEAFRLRVDNRMDEVEQAIGADLRRQSHRTRNATSDRPHNRSDTSEVNGLEDISGDTERDDACDDTYSDEDDNDVY